MRVFRDILRDTAELARNFHGRAGPLELAKTLAYDGSQVLALARMREAAARWGIPVVGGILRRVQVGLFGAEIAREARLGTGVLFLHTVGVVIGGDSHIGDRVVFLGSNTIGSNKKSGFPKIGNDVVIGAGARILGEITIGDGASIGANAVVLRDVPAGASAAGVPAVIRLREQAREAPDPAK
jgi:serine O-acetyltransferase